MCDKHVGAHESELDASWREARIGVVRLQRQPELRARRQHAVRLTRAQCHQIMHEHAHVARGPATVQCRWQSTWSLEARIKKHIKAEICIRMLVACSRRPLLCIGHTGFSCTIPAEMSSLAWRVLCSPAKHHQDGASQRQERIEASCQGWLDQSSVAGNHFYMVLD